MYIHEAVAKAIESPSVLRRPDFPDGVFLMVVPNERYCIYLAAAGLATPVYGWEPSAGDLMADDWTVTKAEGLEWPAEPPAPEKRLWQRLLERGFRRR